MTHSPHRKEGVVLFVSKRVPGSDSPLVRPKPTAASALSPFNDMVKGDTQTADSESSGCCVKKQSVPFSLHANGGNTDEDNGGEEDEDTSDEESLNSSSSSIECDEIDNVSKVVSDCTDEINADEIEVDYFSAEASEDDDDDELSGILEALNQSPVSVTQDEMEASDRIIGVMEDREDVLTIPQVKRVLSYGKLVELSEDAQLKLFSPKRPRLTSRPPTLLEAFAQNSASVYPKPAISMDEDDENCSTLKDELFNYGDSYDYEMNKEKTPVPLLTPPSSPLIFELDGDMTTVCEWPSNLVVDSAMAAVCELRPMSPASLEHWELRDAELTAVDC